MFPVSVEARAKMKITRGQAELLPVSSSVLVLLDWRATRMFASPTASRSTGMAETQAMAKATVAKNFMVDWVLGLVVQLVDCWAVGQLGCWTVGLLDCWTGDVWRRLLRLTAWGSNRSYLYS